MQIMASLFMLSIDGYQDMEVQMETETFHRWLAEPGCTFGAGKDTVGTHGHPKSGSPGGRDQEAT